MKLDYESLCGLWSLVGNFLQNGLVILFNVVPQISLLKIVFKKCYIIDI